MYDVIEKYFSIGKIFLMIRLELSKRRLDQAYQEEQRYSSGMWDGWDGWNPAPEDTFEECTSCEEELRANPSHFNQLFDLSTDPLEEVFSPIFC